MPKIDTSRDEYILAIYEYVEKHGSASNKALAQSLGIRAASVTEMIRKLVDEGDVCQTDKNIRLTEAGKEKAKKLLTKHRLWELFLVQYLGYSWQEVHEDAKALEHVTSESLKNRLNEFLNRPMHCPHGNEIFENHAQEDSLQALAQVTSGSFCRVHKVEDDRELLEYLEEKGIGLEDVLQVKERNAFDLSVLVSCRGENKYIAGKAAEKIMVMPAFDEKG